jgi:hypothetical protein
MELGKKGKERRRKGKGGGEQTDDGKRDQEEGGKLGGMTKCREGWKMMRKRKGR